MVVGFNYAGNSSGIFDTVTKKNIFGNTIYTPAVLYNDIVLGRGIDSGWSNCRVL